MSDWLLDEFLADHPLDEPADNPGPPNYIADPEERLDWMLAFAPEYVRRADERP